ncbi:MAG: hypothetical protein A2925_00015 [Candidatus Yanofskybacteria bacterium RIFCSPLOWO2_01_FULL_44_22]|uniref:Uncharacterized protein n=1 Tax=Candidatus Yanofskybacteria bacterium RIFCSPLOWO2_01_FULL_44_22 TaxID=1802697 RepID=A0A1F8GL65_9BACT|nr:MAG: hypothetical protein A2925_00015 [Candidatus Yanofskybacteria bacterium RIFCSPLOWO2_01_FULL_44_22]
MSNYFFLIFLATIIITRLFIFIYPISAPTFGKFRTHHYMYGLVGIFAGLSFHSIMIYAIGLGLFVDELTYLLIRGKNHKDNYSKISLLGTLFFAIIVFIFRKYFLFF